MLRNVLSAEGVAPEVWIGHACGLRSGGPASRSPDAIRTRVCRARRLRSNHGGYERSFIVTRKGGAGPPTRSRPLVAPRVALHARPGGRAADEASAPHKM